MLRRKATAVLCIIGEVGVYRTLIYASVRWGMREVILPIFIQYGVMRRRNRVLVPFLRRFSFQGGGGNKKRPRIEMIKEEKINGIAPVYWTVWESRSKNRAQTDDTFLPRKVNVQELLCRTYYSVPSRGHPLGEDAPMLVSVTRNRANVIGKLSPDNDGSIA